MVDNKPQNIQHLLIIEDDQGKRMIALQEVTCSIGRDPSNTIVLYSPRISRQHAILLRTTNPEVDGYLFRIIDGNLQGSRSRNGLIVNGQKCFSHDLTYGDEIIFGEEVRARYYVSNNLSDIEFLVSCEINDLSGFLQIMHNPFQTLGASRQSSQELKDSNEASLVRLASYPELFSYPILEVNLSGKIIYLNPAAVQEFPNIREEGVKHPLIHGIIESIRNNTKDFHVRQVSVGHKIFEQSVHYFAGSELIRSYIIEVTERKLAEDALKKAYDNLEMRVEERTSELKIANENLQAEITERQKAEEEVRNALEREKELNELKSRFVSVASHEFRTPLATILSSAQLIECYSHKWGEEKKVAHLQRIQTAVRHMTDLLNDVLLINKAEVGKLEFNPTPISINCFCQEIIEDIQLATHNHTVIFQDNSQCQIINADQKLLRHILTNLLSNAIKYSPDKENVYFDLDNTDGDVIFKVKDEGIGIPQMEQSGIFNSFNRASNVGTISGTGLGLSIVKRSVDLHDGHIELNSEVGLGTTFTITLPLKIGT
jgi:signal transduction histidine kinase/pSer/pThr/pTyr-binding forkhead associated (FHA) protein